MDHFPETNREILPFEHLVLALMCDGLTNRAIANEIKPTEKIVENTISRAADAFSIKSSAERNLRVSLTIAYLAYSGEVTIKKYLQAGQSQVSEVHMATAS